MCWNGHFYTTVRFHLANVITCIARMGLECCLEFSRILESLSILRVLWSVKYFLFQIFQYYGDEEEDGENWDPCKAFLFKQM